MKKLSHLLVVFFPKMKWYNSRINVEFKGSCLKQDKITFTPRNVVNAFIVHEDNLFGAVTKDS